MRLDSPILAFFVVTLALITLVIATFFALLFQAISVSLIMIGIWLVIAGLGTREPSITGVISTPAAYTAWGGIITTVALASLAHMSVSDARMTWLLLILGVASTVILAYYVEKKRQ